MKNYTDLERKKDFDFFISNYDELYKKYGHKFIAIQFEQIIGVYETEIAAIEDVTKSHPLGTFIVQECNGDESGYTNYISSWQLISI